MLVYAFTPGLCEVAEITAHLASSGDLHGSDEERHADHGDTQGDEDECHTCFCHAPTVFLVAVPPPAPACLAPKNQAGEFSQPHSAGDDTIRPLFRPPIA